MPDRLQYFDFLMDLSFVDPKYLKDKTTPSTKQIETIMHNYPMLDRHFNN